MEILFSFPLQVTCTIVVFTVQVWTVATGRVRLEQITHTMAFICTLLLIIKEAVINTVIVVVLFALFVSRIYLFCVIDKR